jgi:exodeoxyribonuclease VII large subunit
VRQVGNRTVWSLEEVSRAVARRFEDIPQRWVEAELRGVRRRGDTLYFNLVDGVSIEANMKSVVFDRLPAPPGDGDRVQALGVVEFWQRKSQVVLRVAKLEPVGEGLLLAQIEALRELLRREGVLTAQRGARPLPLLPRRIGLVTSRDGEARHDFLVNATARFRDVDILLAHAPVQGDAAPGAIARAIRALGEVEGVDVIVIARGGGSLQDLMAFNSELVCRAVVSSRVPVVSGVGHEGDRTLSDEVADHRVSTPTAAAMAVVPDREALEASLGAAELALSRGLARSAREAEASLRATGARLGRSLGAVGIEADRRLAEAGSRATRALRARLDAAPARLVQLERDLDRAMGDRTERADGRIRRAAELLDLLAPERTVSRGYAIVRDEEGAVVADAAGAPAGTRLRVQLRDAVIGARSEGPVDGEGA